MFTVWCKIIKNNKMITDYTIHITDDSLSRTSKVYAALDELCYKANLARPIWLKSNQDEFIKHSRTKFNQDNYIEEIEFDFLDFQIIEEDT